VLFFQAGKIQIGENVAVQNQAPVSRVLEQEKGIARPARIRAEVQV